MKLAATALCLLLPLVTHADTERHAYACDNGSRLDISFSADSAGRPQAILHFADEAIVLPGVPAASGAQYRSGEIRLHAKGSDAVVDDGKGNVRRCSRGAPPPPAEPPARHAVASGLVDLSGRVTYLSRIALPPGAVLSLRIQDTTRTPARVLVEQRYELDGTQVPIPFTATVDRDLIGKNPHLTVTARIDYGGKPRFTGTGTYPSFAGGQPRPLDLVLKPAAPTRR